MTPRTNKTISQHRSPSCSGGTFNVSTMSLTDHGNRRSRHYPHLFSIRSIFSISGFSCILIIFTDLCGVVQGQVLTDLSRTPHARQSSTSTETLEYYMKFGNNMLEKYERGFGMKSPENVLSSNCLFHSFFSQNLSMNDCCISKVSRMKVRTQLIFADKYENPSITIILIIYIQ